MYCSSFGLHFGQTNLLSLLLCPPYNAVNSC